MICDETLTGFLWRSVDPYQQKLKPFLQTGGVRMPSCLTMFQIIQLYVPMPMPAPYLRLCQTYQ